MKFNLHNQHRRRSGGDPSISLFPFLAVLICTMGALVPLLFAITRQARMQAAQTAVVKIAEKKAEIKTEHETMQWRIGQLKISREKTDGQVADARLELGHLEDHARGLREKIPALEKTVAELDKLDGDDSRQQSEKMEELERLRLQIEAAKKQVTDAQIEATSRKKSYAIVPYEGPNQTYRRPIYLECRADAVVLRPEGIEFPEGDFEGPLGPGNPLASGLRAVREYLLSNHGFDPQREGEPYPLLLVRPDGIAAYYAARAAMTSWATDFGYELIEADWKLAFQPPDAQLAKVVQEVLVSARARQQRLIAAAPAAYSKKPKAVYRASPHGGSVRIGGPAYDDEDSEDSGYVPRQSSGRGGRGYGPAGGGSEVGDVSGPAEAQQLASLYGNAGSGTVGRGNRVIGPGGGTIASGSGEIGGDIGGQADAAPGGGNRATGYGDGSIVPRGAVSGSSTGNMNAGLTGQGTPGDGQFINPMRTDSGPSGSNNGNVGGFSGPAGGGSIRTGDNSATAGQDNTKGSMTPPEGYVPAGKRQGTGNKGSSRQTGSTEGYIVGQPPSEKNLPDQTSPSTGKQAMPNQANARLEMPLRPGEWRDPPQKPPVTKPDDEKDAKKDQQKNGKHPKDLASKRGQDWALPDAAHGSVPVTRPIKIECRPDQLVIVPESGLSSGKVVSLGPRTETSTETFISAVWEHMDAWGIAGRGMYWRPILNVYVAPGAEQRFADLQMLLEGSGLKIVRK